MDNIPQKIFIKHGIGSSEFNRITVRVWSKAQPPYAFRVEKGMD